MTKTNNYLEKLKDPRWQKKRLEIMERDNFACRNCGDDESTLNVHHKYYEKGNDVWDYPDNSLITLCQTCHEIESDNIFESFKELNKQIRKNFLQCHIHRISWGFESIKMVHQEDVVANAISNALRDEGIMNFIVGKYFAHLNSANPEAEILHRSNNGEEKDDRSINSQR